MTPLALAAAETGVLFLAGCAAAWSSRARYTGEGCPAYSAAPKITITSALFWGVSVAARTICDPIMPKNNSTAPTTANDSNRRKLIHKDFFWSDGL